MLKRMTIGEYYWLGVSIVVLGFYRITNNIDFAFIGTLTVTCAGLLFFSRMWKEYKEKK